MQQLFTGILGWIGAIKYIDLNRTIAYKSLDREAEAAAQYSERNGLQYQTNLPRRKTFMGPILG